MIYENKKKIKMQKIVHRVYDLPQPEGPLAVKDYLLGTVEGERCCILRFIKKLDVLVTRITFEIIQLNAGGAEIGRTPYTLVSSGSHQEGVGETFAPNCAMPIDDACTAIKIKIVEVISGSYVYTAHNKNMCVDYRMEESMPSEGDNGSKKKVRAKYTVRSKLGKRPRIIWLFAILVILMLSSTILRWYFVNIVPMEQMRDAIILFLENAAKFVVRALRSAIDYLSNLEIDIGGAIRSVMQGIEWIFKQIFELISRFISELTFRIR